MGVVVVTQREKREKEGEKEHVCVCVCVCFVFIDFVYFLNLIAPKNLNCAQYLHPILTHQIELL